MYLVVAPKRKRIKRKRVDQEEIKNENNNPVVAISIQIPYMSLHVTMQEKFDGRSICRRSINQTMTIWPLLLLRQVLATKIMVAAQYFTTTTTGLLLSPLVHFDLSITQAVEAGWAWNLLAAVQIARSSSGIFFDQSTSVSFLPNGYSMPSLFWPVFREIVRSTHGCRRIIALSLAKLFSYAGFARSPFHCDPFLIAYCQETNLDLYDQSNRQRGR
mmetsp:Transcript_28588/g.59883  ORF Transcript_28588/g.59883 Transcript_28588/m.59883 type:complete len:216 (+) Transcript_28588:540-1187(+)